MKNCSSMEIAMRVAICIILLGSMALISTNLSGCSDVFYPKVVTGVVSEKPEGRWDGSKTGERFAVELEAWDSDNKKVVGDVAGGSGSAKTIVVDCLSTRCASLRRGDRVVMDCKHQVRWFEPNVISCKLASVSRVERAGL